MDVQFIMIMTIFVWNTENGPILPQNIDVSTQRQNVLKTHVPTRIHHQWRISTNTRRSQDKYTNTAKEMEKYDEKVKKLLSEVGFEPTPTEVDCDLNAAP